MKNLSSKLPQNSTRRSSNKPISHARSHVPGESVARWCLWVMSWCCTGDDQVPGVGSFCLFPSLLSSPPLQFSLFPSPSHFSFPLSNPSVWLSWNRVVFWVPGCQGGAVILCAQGVSCQVSPLPCQMPVPIYLSHAA